MMITRSGNGNPELKSYRLRPKSCTLFSTIVMMIKPCKTRAKPNYCWTSSVPHLLNMIENVGPDGTRIGNVFFSGFIRRRYAVHGFYNILGKKPTALGITVIV